MIFAGTCRRDSFVRMLSCIRLTSFADSLAPSKGFTNRILGSCRISAAPHVWSRRSHSLIAVCDFLAYCQAVVHPEIRVSVRRGLSERIESSVETHSSFICSMIVYSSELPKRTPWGLRTPSLLPSMVIPPVCGSICTVGTSAYGLLRLILPN